MEVSLVQAETQVGTDKVEGSGAGIKKKAKGLGERLVKGRSDGDGVARLLRGQGEESKDLVHRGAELINSIWRDGCLIPEGLWEEELGSHGMMERKEQVP